MLGHDADGGDGHPQSLKLKARATTKTLLNGKTGVTRMIKLQGKLPRKIYVACSGGVDSMAVVDFLNRKHDVFVLHFNHGTEHGNKAMQFVEKYCKEKDIPWLTNIPANNREKTPRESQEEY